MNAIRVDRLTLSHQGKLPKDAKRCQGLHQSKRNYVLTRHSTTLLEAANANGRDCSEEIGNRTRDARHFTWRASGPDSDIMLPNRRPLRGC